MSYKAARCKRARPRGGGTLHSGRLPLAQLGEYESPNPPKLAWKEGDSLDHPNRALPITPVSHYPHESGIPPSYFET